MSSVPPICHRFTDIGGHRFTAFAADARKGQIASLELRQRSREVVMPNARAGVAG
jgi:hypothetical protein